MKIRMPLPVEKWTAAYQALINGILERAFEKFNPSAVIPPGGTTGQVLTKNSDRDYDVKWV